jgi:hypothetical protein
VRLEAQEVPDPQGAPGAWALEEESDLQEAWVLEEGLDHLEFLALLDLQVVDYLELLTSF